MAAQQFTPWQKMKAYETQVRKIEDHWRIVDRNKKNLACQDEDDGIIIAEPLESCCGKVPLTYYNNVKCNNCCKEAYDYNFFYCNGYDQYRAREDRKHVTRYMNIDLEEEFPCRAVPILTSSNYGHRPRAECPFPWNDCPIPRNHSTATFYRNRGTNYCMNANGGNDFLRLNPTTSFNWNAHYGYTYSPPRN